MCFLISGEIVLKTRIITINQIQKPQISSNLLKLFFHSVDLKHIQTHNDRQIESVFCSISEGF